MARNVLIVGQARDVEFGRILAMGKANSGPKPRSLSWRVIGRSVPLSDGTEGDSHPVIEWIGECDATADELMAPSPTPEERGKLEDAEVFLREQLADGPVAQPDLIERAKKESIATGTLKRAKKSLGVRSSKSGNGWAWALPAPRTPAPSGASWPLVYVGSERSARAVGPVTGERAESTAARRRLGSS